MSIETVYSLLPETALVLVATLIYVIGAFVPARRFWGWVGCGALLVAGFALVQQNSHSAPPSSVAGSGIRENSGETASGETVAAALRAASPLSLDAAGNVDTMGQYIRWLALIVGMVLVLTGSRTGDDVQEPEFIGTLLLAVAGVMVVSIARDLVLIFLGVELISIPSYVLLYLGRRDVSSQESATKYFFLSILSSALTLYGFSFLYGVGRSTDLAAVAEALAAEAARPSGLEPLAAVALLLVFAGLGFKVTAVPFHFYAPDVYQGTTNLNAAVLAVLPKIAGFVALVRITLAAMPGSQHFGWQVAIVLSVLTMTVGNLLALWQDNIRRLMAYSSVAHAGYMLIGLTVAFVASMSGQTSGLDGAAAVIFYLVVYSLATAGTFAALSFLGGEGREIDGVDELAGLNRSHPITALALAVFMFSLAGIPPLAGFWGKFMLFGSALTIDEADVASGWTRTCCLVLAVVGVLNAAVAAAYYLRIVMVMYFRPPLATPRAAGGFGAALATVLCALLVVLVGLFPGPLLTRANEAGVFARAPAEAPSLADGR